VENLATTTATSQKTMDHIVVPLQKARVKSPARSPHQSAKLTTSLQSEDLAR